MSLSGLRFVFCMPLSVHVDLISRHGNNLKEQKFKRSSISVTNTIYEKSWMELSYGIGVSAYSPSFTDSSSFCLIGKTKSSMKRQSATLITAMSVM